MNLFPIGKRWIRFFLKFPVRIFSKMETFGGKYGNVGNDLAHRVEVL